MRIGSLLAAVAIATMVSTVSAVDLMKIDRKILSEPKYETETPEYCLLVFGQDADKHIWMVRDGKTLYVDRNSNGKLGEPGERVSAGRSPTFLVKSIALSGSGKQPKIHRIRIKPADDIHRRNESRFVAIGIKVAASPEIPA